MNRLREVRILKRITQFRLHLVTGIPASKISLMENGLVIPREDEKIKLAKALMVTPEKIWGKGESEVQELEGEDGK